jgi:hypothetical protein
MAMKGRMKVYVGLLVVALVVLGTGVGLLTTRPAKLELTDASPVVSVEAYYYMEGYKDRLFIYTDGTIIRVEDRGLRVPSADRPATRTRGKGTLGRQELSDLLGVPTGDGIADLDRSYDFPGNPSSDLWYTLVVSNGPSPRSVIARGYLSADMEVTQPDMPHPLDELYAELHDIATNRTQEVAKETIQTR